MLSRCYRPVANWPAGKPGDFPVGPCFKKFFGPTAVHANLFIDSQLTQSADRLSIQRTGHDVRRLSPSERTTVMYLIYSPAGYRLLESKLFLMRTKKTILPFLRP